MQVRGIGPEVQDYADLYAEKCEPGLIFWLVEELLDTQTIDGCRIIFDYLDSRRERITAVSDDHHPLGQHEADRCMTCRNTSSKSSLSS